MSDKTFTLAMIGLAVILLTSIVLIAAKMGNENKGTYTIQCAVITPNGPVQTVNLKAHNVVVTDFGIVKMKEGLYIPTTNEICVIKKESE